MHDAPVIGLHGRARAGKDTVANFILAHRGGYIYSL
jgi:dephospho-CoA kinase